MADASGSLPLELLDRGDPAFVDAIRQVHDADALAAFAEVWFADPRPDSRRLLLEYLDRPLNAYRHEGLIKRLFKRAEAVGDDELMARFLVLFDRSVRRVRRTRFKFVHGVFTTKAEADATALDWRSLGYPWVQTWDHSGQFLVHGSRPEERIIHPRKTTMPQGRMVEIDWWHAPGRKALVPDWALAASVALDWDGRLIEPSFDNLPHVREKLKKFRLFRLATRNYLRRRAWRYFRKLGKTQPERYVNAVSLALNLYRDDDSSDGLALIDNWGLMHILFHHSPAIEAKPGGWTIRAGHSLGELSPTPIYENLWDHAPERVVGLLSTARSSTVRRWAIRRIEADPSTHRSGLPIEGWLDLLGHADPQVASLASKMLEGMDGLDSVSVDRWLSLAESTDPAGLEVLCSLIGRSVKADQVTLDQAVKLAALRALPVAKLGFSWLKSKSVREPAEILPLIDAECSMLRPEIFRWLRSLFDGSTVDARLVVMECLDSRQADARAEGWAWFSGDRELSEDVVLWRKLLESPHDEIRLALVSALESKSKITFNSSDLRPLWASVLLNIHRGSRAKPLVVRQLIQRLNAKPDEVAELLPMLSVALRSSRGPERRAGLVAVVQLVEQRSEVETLVRSTFPELQGIGDSDR
jgi:hypothetical protein